MKNIEIVSVDIEDSEVVISLLGGPSNIVGTIRFFERDEIKRHDLRRRAEALMNHHVLVDLAVSFSTGRWRLIGCNREVIGGLEPTKLEISQTLPEINPKPTGNWGLARPAEWPDLEDEE